MIEIFRDNMRCLYHQYNGDFPRVPPEVSVHVTSWRISDDVFPTIVDWRKLL